MRPTFPWRGCPGPMTWLSQSYGRNSPFKQHSKSQIATFHNLLTVSCSSPSQALPLQAPQSLRSAELHPAVRTFQRVGAEGGQNFPESWGRGGGLRPPLSPRLLKLPSETLQSRLTADRFRSQLRELSTSKGSTWLRSGLRTGGASSRASASCGPAWVARRASASSCTLGASGCWSAAPRRRRRG